MCDVQLFFFEFVKLLFDLMSVKNINNLIILKIIENGLPTDFLMVNIGEQHTKIRWPVVIKEHFAMLIRINIVQVDSNSIHNTYNTPCNDISDGVEKYIQPFNGHTVNVDTVGGGVATADYLDCGICS